MTQMKIENRTSASKTDAADTDAAACPALAERFFFDNNGYLVLEEFLDVDHVNALLQALRRVMKHRRSLQEQELPHTGITTPMGKKSARIFYILDDDPLFLEMLDWPAIWPYVTGLLNARPHHHASDAIVEHGSDLIGRGMRWHIDGIDDGFRNLGPQIPLLQLKIGYYLSDMTQPGQGNLCVVPGSHKAAFAPNLEDLQRWGTAAGVTEICAPAGTAVLFHNALWHSAGPFSSEKGRRAMLYYAYEHPWMIASQEHWSYPSEFYNRLSPARRKLFHGFLFDPPEQRWG
ncbi:MAG: phytanoyl-CoA dioxygenase family protein [Caldilineaceae bacterium SB0661_bin_32]|uniref:Phytanoyl-CoA dioxygenase family protein n=1 Tax=Caldilineaceae bacterium SB0661_bin_32 TaxID=2605255 RepID=A0A6B1D5W2_9CHLR|nr:phytanoyl-CoA dioxygenase family protein [Caldilineaceae bacterium SB0661_bin_32]